MLKCIKYIVTLLPLIAQAQPEEGLVAKVTFNKGTAVYEKGNDRIRASGVSFSDDRFGNEKSSVYVHGNPGSYVNLGTGKALKPPSASISLWVNIDVVIYSGRGYSVNPIILTKNDTASDFYEAYAFSYQFMVRKIVSATTNSKFEQVTVHSAPITINDWHHIVLAYNDDSTWLYIDGSLDTKMYKGFRTKFNPLDSVMVGNSANHKNQRFLCGSVDDIFIFDRVISAKEVNALFKAPDPNRYHVIMGFVYKGAGVAAIIALLVWFFVRRSKKELEKEKEKNRNEARLNEMETKAIRTQMNPHFIFNSLNTLQRFILEEDVANSNLYLTKFSGLLRKLIESSVSDSISLSEEIDILKSYTEIESMRFDNSFDVEIENNVLKSDLVHVPFMLVQPFVENAIWHGLLPKKGQRNLKISFWELDSRRIMCAVDDNGVGRQNAQKETRSPLKKKSLAIDFIRQRLEILEKSTEVKCSFEIIDKKDDDGQSIGTLIEIIMPNLNHENSYINN